MADLYVMPSVSEPFGIAPLEAMQHDVPVIISKQSGVTEVFQHALKVDFWDINEMANKIIAVLRHPPLHEHPAPTAAGRLCIPLGGFSGQGQPSLLHRVLNRAHISSFDRENK